MALPKKENEKEQRARKTDKRGFYAALAICFLAIGIAAWSTYDTMLDYMSSGSVGTVTSAAIHAHEDPGSSRLGGQSTASVVETDTAPEVNITEESTAAPVQEVSEAEEAPVLEPTAEPVAAPADYVRSDGYIRPVSSDEILAHYSEIPVYSESMRDYRAHLGTDYRAERGETIKAMANGIVKDTYTDMLLGNIILIEHGDTQISYCGVGETFLVKPGEVVRSGQDIGSVTAAPFESAMETHLHIEATRDGNVIDPETLFN